MFLFQIIDLNGIADKIEIRSEVAADLRMEHFSNDKVRMCGLLTKWEVNMGGCWPTFFRVYGPRQR